MLHKIKWLMSLVSLTGCMMGPDYQEEIPKVPNHWQAEQKPIDDLKPADLEVLRNWWKRFGDAQLNSLMAQALDGNIDLKMALTRIDQARAERRSTRAEFFPTVNITTGAEHQENPFPGFAPGVSYDVFELGFDALWEIDLFGRQRRLLEVASADLTAAVEQHRQALVTLTSELARGYIEYRSLQNQLHIARLQQEAQRHTLELTKKRFKGGVSAYYEVVWARAQTKTTAAQIPELEGQMTAALRKLEVLLGREPGALTESLHKPGIVPAAPGREILASPAETIRRRPDIRIAERRLAAATAMQGAAIAELFPRISISAFLGLRNTNLESLFKTAAFSYGTAANLLQPLLNFGRIRAGIDLAEAKQKEAYLAYKKAVLQALQETETSLIRYLKEEVRRQALSRSVVNLREYVHQSQLRFYGGVISFLDVLDARRALFVSENDLVRSEAKTSTNLIALYKALGGGMNAMLQPENTLEK